MNKSDQNLAACRHDPEAMYCDPGDTLAVHAAKKLCAGCDVRDACYRQAMHTGEKWGIWGGFTPVERARIAEGKPVRQCSRCRTLFVGASHQHRCGRCSLNEPPRRSINEHRDTIVAMAGQGHTDGHIGEVVGYAAKTVRKARQRWGVESGRTVRARRDGVAETVREMAPCGTDAAYRRHLRHGEPVDEVCRSANARRSADIRAAA